MKTTRAMALLLVAATNYSCGIIGTDSALNADGAAYAGSIRVSLKGEANAKENDYLLLFSANQDILTMGLCVARDTPTCTQGGTGYFAAPLIWNDGTKNFFQPKSSAILEDGLILTVVGTDKSGAVVDSRNVKFIKKGAATATATTTTPPTNTATTTPPTNTATTTPPTNTTTTPPTNTNTNTVGGTTAGATGGATANGFNDPNQGQGQGGGFNQGGGNGGGGGGGGGNFGGGGGGW